MRYYGIESPCFGRSVKLTCVTIDEFWGKSLPATLLLLIATAVRATAASPGLDPSFNAGRGPSHVQPGVGQGVLIQPDGKILIGGNFNAVNLTDAGPIVRLRQNLSR